MRVGADTPVFRSWWFNRFQLRQAGCELHFRDALLERGRVLPAEQFTTLEGRALDLAFFQQGFMQAAVSAVPGPVAQRPYGSEVSLFWQFPCRTEGAAWDRHEQIGQPRFADGALHIYLGLPWATWIDKGRKRAWGQGGAAAMLNQLRLLRVRLSGLRGVLATIDVRLRVHTVCQHIYWQDMLPAWRQLGITDAWLSHCPAQRVPMADANLVLHPWALFAVNVEDPDRRVGLTPGKDPANRSIKASFVGAHAPHYLSDVRLRLREHSDLPGWVVILTNDWHFESAVYEHQIAGGAFRHTSAVNSSVERYNRLMSDSVFALCPAGAGANTLRLWEALAVGAVPVLLGHQPVLPIGGTLPAVDWERIVLRVKEEDLSRLPQRLKAMPLAEVRARQKLGMQAYEMVKAQRCF